jgi:hypothetical protein
VEVLKDEVNDRVDKDSSINIIIMVMVMVDILFCYFLICVKSSKLKCIVCCVL